MVAMFARIVSAEPDHEDVLSVVRHAAGDYYTLKGECLEYFIVIGNIIELI
jgi:hypothetical protein